MTRHFAWSYLFIYVLDEHLCLIDLLNYNQIKGYSLLLISASIAFKVHLIISLQLSPHPLNLLLIK